MEMLVLVLVAAAAVWWLVSRSKKSRSNDVPLSSSEMPIELKITITSDISPQSEREDDTDKDAWDEEALRAYMRGDARSLAGKRLHITFEDRLGKVTERDIDTVRYVRTSDGMGGVLWAFCRLRGANRPFRFSRIRKATDLETGEIITDIGAWLDAAYAERPEYPVEVFLNHHGAAMYTLFAVAKGDGAMRANERKVILAFAERKGLSDAAHQQELERQLKDWFGDTRTAFWDAVKAAPTKGYTTDDLRELLSTMQQVADLGNGVHPEEQRMLNYAAKTWALPLPK